jgi:Sap, sulfolipid-1-addressing protein
MDLASLATLVLMALALAAQPWSVLAGIVLVAARGGVVKEVAYVVGWVAALSVVMAITVALAPDTPSTAASTVTAAAEIALGLALGIVLAVRWRRVEGTTAPTPSWMGRLDAMPWFLALALGAFLPNYVIVVGAATEMLQVGLTGTSLAVVGIAFVLVASLGVAAPLGVLVARRDRAPEVYAGWRTWITTHSRTVTYGMGAVVAVVLVVKGLWGVAT